MTETVPTGWTLTNTSCFDGSAPDAIDLAAGETVTCTFVYSRQGGTSAILMTLMAGWMRQRGRRG